MSSPSLTPDLLAQFFGGKLPFGDQENVATPPPGLMMRPPQQPMPITPAGSPAPAAQPAETPLPPIPTAPKLRGPNTELQGKLATAQAPIDESKYKPKWYDYLAGGLAGFGAGYGSRNPQLGGQIASGVVDRRLNSARDDQSRTVDSLTKQLEQEDRANKQYNDTEEHTFKNNMDVATEARARQSSDRLASYRDDVNELKANIAAGKTDIAQQNLERMEQNAKDNAGYRMQMLQQKQELIDLKEKMAGKEKPASKAQSLQIENKRDRAWNQAHRDYAKSLTMLGKNDTKGQEQARQDYYDSRQKAQDDYENDIGVLGGGAEHVELPRNHFGEKVETPTAQPNAAPTGQPSSAPKSVGKSVVADYAKSHKMTYQQAEQGFKSKGYTVQ